MSAQRQVNTINITLSFLEKIEAFLSRLSVKSRFFNWLLSFFYMPAVFSSGIRMKMTPQGFEAILPYRRFNRNSYSTMSGAALLGSCEVAAGGYIYFASEGQFQVVCKDLDYRFRASCSGPVKYVVLPNEQLQALLTQLKPFTISLQVKIYQTNRQQKNLRRIGQATATFHARPIGYQRLKQRRSS